MDRRHPLRAGGMRLADITGGRLLGDTAPCQRLELDSRRVQPGDLFVALCGDTHDGHDFVGEAIARGAHGVLVERPPGCELPQGVFAVVVPSTRAALIDLARARRDQLTIPVLAITGTCGKTTTKEMLRHLLAGCCKVHASPKSFNNDIGLPWTLLEAPEDCEALVLEIGTNGPGEIAALAAIARPTHACVTMAGRGHLERLGSVDGVAHEKSALLHALPADGGAVLNADDPRLAVFERACSGRRILRFGIGERAQLRASELRLDEDGVSFELRIPEGTSPAEGRVRRVRIPRLGMPALRNFLAAFGLAQISGLAQSPAALLARSESLPVVARRLERKPGPHGSVLLDDSYNANPESLLAAASVVDRWPGVRRRLLVLGEMRELGSEAETLHRELGAAMAGRFDVLLAIGEGAAPAAEGFARARQLALSLDDAAGPGIAIGARPRPFESLVLPGVEAALQWLHAHLGAGDLVLLKGSRLAAIDQLVDALVAETAPSATSSSGAARAAASSDPRS